MPESPDLPARQLLDRLEQEETRLLSWGVVEIGFSNEEVRDHARTVLDAAGSLAAPDDLRDLLLERRLLFAFEREGAEVYRTRMAETVRLLARLRQLFPDRDWRLAPTLVADFRFAYRARRYPRQHLSPDAVLADVERDIPLSPLRRQALAALLRSQENRPLQLADFQLLATRRVLQDLRGRTSRGVIVCAGTGTGKTLAFYLPALTHAVGLVEKDAFWTKMLAIYPRNELLKDQLSETYQEARRLDRVLKTAGRKLRLGAFFGPTPRRIDDVRGHRDWPSRAAASLCPYLRCPRCEGDVVWRDDDVKARRERLVCTRPGCGGRIEGDEVALTRKSMEDRPPDILFTTTEMLNRQLGNSRSGHVFVGSGSRRPQVMLLDEVHTYSGTTGAQVALLLRRWQHAVGAKVQFTGLSATLRDAGEFFTELTGLPQGAVDEVSPGGDDLDHEPESMEYLLALRGDPVSGTSLLSTTIQAAMLLRRSLEPADESPSDGLYGRRVFLFTDDLDVTNRLYNDLQDAEGRDSWGNVVGEPLAALRSSSRPDNGARLALGQSWQMCEDIGHPYGLTESLRIGRTAAIDPGVDLASAVIVATSALEVGFNDPEVGAVMQHKAPLDWASFVQRKGRAGRRRRMRPWTLVVLSDYGRDRLAYQAYEQLFDPELPRRRLPVGNRSVLRMQAAFAFMDWLARQLPPNTPAGSLWADLSGPVEATEPWAAGVRRRQEMEQQIVSELLDNHEGRMRSLEGYLRAALRIDAENLQAILWEPPRALLTSVLPTLLRRLESGWKRVTAHPGESPRDYWLSDHPLPDFVPRQLFGELNLPDVEIVIPPQSKNDSAEAFFLPIAQAMRTLAPGRVTRRFGYKHAYSSHWVRPGDLAAPAQDMTVESLCDEADEAGTFQAVLGGQVRDIRCIRPWRVKPIRPDRNVLATSNSFLQWHSQLSAAREEPRLHLTPPRHRAWPKLLDSVCFYLHNHQTHVQVRRFATGAEANLRLEEGIERTLKIRFTDEQAKEQAAIGYSLEVDGVAFRYRLPADLSVAPDHPNQPKIRSFRTVYFLHRVQNDEALTALANSFQRDWLGQLYLSALTLRAIREPQRDAGTLPHSHSALASDMGVWMSRVLEVIFQALPVEDKVSQKQKVHEKLLGLCRTPEVTAALHRLAPVLWEAPDAGWYEFAARRYKATLGAALLEACRYLCPQVEAGDLLLDLDPGPRPPGVPPLAGGFDEIWITESGAGGGGIIEEVLRSYLEDPRRFYRLAESALSVSDFELVDRELTRLLDWVEADAGLRDLMKAVRDARDQHHLQQAEETLAEALSERGLVLTHAVRSALHARVLRPGSSAATDSLLRRLVSDWRQREEELGIEIDARVFAYLASVEGTYQALLAQAGLTSQPDALWRYQVFFGLLWPRSSIIRGQGLASYNPFAAQPLPDRELVLDLLQSDDVEVPLDAADWQERVRRALKEGGSVRLRAGVGEGAKMKAALLLLAATPLEVDFLHLHPHVESVEQDAAGLTVTLDLREVLP
jgi:hypothetical protein